MTIIERWFQEVWNEGRESSIEELFAPHAIAHGLKDAQGNDVHSREAFLDYYRQMRSALSELNVRVDDVITQGDRSVAMHRHCAAHR